MTATLAGVRIDPDGTRADIAPPRGVDLLPWLREELGGWPELAHYGTREHAVCVIVHETSMVDGLPANCVATTLVEELRGGLLDYHLHGTVFLFGYENPGETADLRAETRELLDTIAALHAAAGQVAP
jgi:hypothetical protein